MHSNWPTRQEDLSTAQDIIKKHIDFNDGEPLGLFEFIIGETEKVNCRVSDWVVELSDVFNEKYGPEKGTDITQRVVSVCLLRNETIH